MKKQTIYSCSILSQVWNLDGVALNILLDYEFQWPQVGFNCKSLADNIMIHLAEP